MANEEHLAILRQGVEVWNTWRKGHPEARPDLRKGDLVKANLQEANLQEANLQWANLQWANLQWANLQEASLRGIDLFGANLQRANFAGANLQWADLREANLRWADFQEANLVRVNFQEAVIQETNFTNAHIGNTLFDYTDLSEVIGIETIQHRGLSDIGINTLIRAGKLPESFLRGCGMPDSFIEYFPSLVGAMEPIQFYSCFISYSTKDEAFARRLHERMRAEHLRVWFAPDDIQGGKKIHEQLEGAIQLYDKLLLVLSDHSIASEWVATEIHNARRTELRQQRRKLFPIRLTDMDALKAWRSFDADTGKDLAREVREYHIPDFSNWKDHDAFELAFARLLRDLRATEAPPAPGALPPVVVQPSAQAHRDSLIATKTRRLYALEEQAAQRGINVPVEMQLEIEDLREELKRLRAQGEG